MTDKERYIQYCRNQEGLPIFFKDYWLDVVCAKGEWDVVIDSKGDLTNGYFVYYRKKKYGLALLAMPPLTPHLGIWYNYPLQPLKKERKTAFELETSKNLISKIPSFFYFNMNLIPQVQNFLSFKWAGYKQTTKFTYVVDTSKNEAILWEQLKDKTRNIIRKAKQTVSIEKSDDIEIFNQLNEETFSRQGLALPYSNSTITQLYKNLQEHQSASILLAKSQNGENIASIFLVHDNTKMYSIAIGSNNEARKTGAVPLCIWEGILLAKKMGLQFDFEGSIMQNIEPFFRSFGGTQIAYHQIYNSKNNLTNALLSLTGKF